MRVSKQVNFVEQKSYPEFGTGNPIPYLSKRKDVKDSYQIKEGHIEEVDGVVLNVDRNVLRTPAVIVDALLGQGEALDCFAMKIQEENTKKKQIENQKEQLILDTLSAITDPVARAEAMAKIFNPVTTIVQGNTTSSN